MECPVVIHFSLTFDQPGSIHGPDGRELFTFGGNLVKKKKKPYLNSLFYYSVLRPVHVFANHS